MDNESTRRGNPTGAKSSMHRTAPAPDPQQTAAIPTGEHHLDETHLSPGGGFERLRPLLSAPHSRQTSQNSIMTDPFQNGPLAAVGHAPAPSDEKHAITHFSTGGPSKTVRPFSRIHSRHQSQHSVIGNPFLQSHHVAVGHTKISQAPTRSDIESHGFPFDERPSIESLAIGALPRDLDPEEHRQCVALLQDAQAALDTLKMRVKVSEHNNDILADKVESLNAEVADLSTKASVSDKQYYQDRVDRLTRQVEYLSTVPHNEKYIGRLEMFEAEARAFRQTKFSMEQTHSQQVGKLEQEMEILKAKLQTTEECYSSELARVSNAMQRERTSKEVIHQTLMLAEAKIANLEDTLHRQRSTTSQLRAQVHEQRNWIHASDDRNIHNVRCIRGMLEQVTHAVDQSNQELAMTNRALNHMQGLPTDPPITPRRLR
ncbi:uncharacterized protein IWZ02DRAFT_432787 [Phyllosticta citriasiana]|uniref:uncharacterized protein n=1 Tax=Phyllosticta citriasiana TaxID=595635 RepID=UPI0030FDF6E9